MDLLKNPFYILNASPRDNRRRLVELSDERSLLRDANQCQEARLQLTTPRKRLPVEMAWLLDLSPQQTQKMLTLMSKSSQELWDYLDELPALAQVNLLAGALVRLHRNNPNHHDDVASWIYKLAIAFDELDANEIHYTINVERQAAGFPEVLEIADIENEIQERRQFFRRAIKFALNFLPTEKLIAAITIVTQWGTINGEEPDPTLIADLVDLYEIEAQGFFEKEAENLTQLGENMRTSAKMNRSDAALRKVIVQLKHVTKNWNSVAYPIQLSRKGRGLNHDDSVKIFMEMRSLAIEMFNEYDKLHISREINQMLQTLATDVGEVADRLADDMNTLNEIEARHKQEERDKAELLKALTYEAEIGILFKDKLRISIDGIEWKGRLTPLDEITRIRWGGVSSSSKTTYYVVYCTARNCFSIKLEKSFIFSTFIDRLWKTVGVRLLTEYLLKLENDETLHFKDAMISDNGIYLKKRGLFSSSERIFFRWYEITWKSFNGNLIVRSRKDPKFMTQLSYKDDDNTMILEAILRLKTQ